MITVMAIISKKNFSGINSLFRKFIWILLIYLPIKSHYYKYFGIQFLFVFSFLSCLQSLTCMCCFVSYFKLILGIQKYKKYLQNIYYINYVWLVVYICCFGNYFKVTLRIQKFKYYLQNIYYINYLKLVNCICCFGNYFKLTMRIQKWKKKKKNLHKFLHSNKTTKILAQLSFFPISYLYLLFYQLL